jgi:hypothetical protein
MIADLDDDNDGVLDVADAYALISLGGLTDTDGDGQPNDCDSDCIALGMTADLDDDNDGVVDTADAFALISLDGRLDTDGDGYPDDCDSACQATGLLADADDDNDGVIDESDAFPKDPAATKDSDNDGVSDESDAFPEDPSESLDVDSDGAGDNSDNCPLVANVAQLDTDKDNQGDVCDNDDDNDGVDDESDAFPINADESLDTDLDGVGDNADNCPLVANLDQRNTDGDAQGDACDADDDNDGSSDDQELADGTDPLDRFSCNRGCFSFDIDESLAAQPLTDGLLVIRYLFGFSGDALVSGAVDGAASRGDAGGIETYLKSAEAQLDIDDDGEAGPLTDGLLLIRYLFGFSGEALVAGAVGEGAQRKNSDDIAAYIEARIPGT